MYCELSISFRQQKQLFIASLVILQVETSDHARLQIKLAFNNYFDVDRTDPQSVEKIFSVNDFIGFACKQVGKYSAIQFLLTNFFCFVACKNIVF